MSQSYLWKKGERELGPVSLADMRRMIRAGTLARYQKVSADGGASFADASMFPELWESEDLIPLTADPSPVVTAAIAMGSEPIAIIPKGGEPGFVAQSPTPVRSSRGFALAGFITATVGLTLTLGPLLIWLFGYAEGYWAVPVVLPLLVASVTGLALSSIALARQVGGFASSGLILGICGTALGFLTAVGWLVSHDPRDAWIVRMTATAEADMQIARRNFVTASKRYKERAPKDDHAEARERMTKDFMLLTQAHKNLLQAAASTPKFSRYFRKLGDLQAAFVSFNEAVSLQDKIDAQKAIDDIGQSSASLKELLDLWDLYQTGQLTIDSVQAKFRDF